MKVGSLVKVKETQWIGTVVLEGHVFVLAYWTSQRVNSWEFKKDLKVLCE
jgi:hypothetical protein